MKPILVTGATGRLGRHVVEALRAKGRRVRALTRRAAKATFPADVEVVECDLADPPSVAPALAGVAAVHLITVAGDDYETLRSGPELVALAERAGVERVVVLWNGAPGPVERAVEGSALSWTRVEPTDFMANSLHWASSIRGGSVVEEPFVDATNALVDELDVAAVVASALVDPGHHGKIYAPTGPSALTIREQVETIAHALGREVRLRELSRNEAVERWRAMGLGEAMIDTLLTWKTRAPRSASTVTSVVRDLTGHPPTDFARWVRRNMESFSGA